MEFLSPPPFFFYLVKLATGTLFISFLILLPGNAFCQCFWNTKMPLQPLYNVAFHLEHIPPFLHVAGLSGLVLCMRWSSHLSDLEREVSHRWTLSCSPALARGRLSAFLTGQQPILFLGLPVGEMTPTFKFSPYFLDHGRVMLMAFQGTDTLSPPLMPCLCQHNELDNSTQPRLSCSFISLCKLA